MKEPPRYIRLGDVHRSPAGVSMYADSLSGSCVVMRPVDAWTPADNVAVPISAVIEVWPRVADNPGGRVVWMESRGGRP